MNNMISVQKAIELLLDCGVGVMPTDTVYGLVARAKDPKAVARLYALKRREHKPGTVIAASVKQLVDLGVDEKYLRQVEHLWPNPVSVETPLGEQLSYMHQGTGREGLRVVADERVRRVLEVTGPLVTSSANQPGEPMSTTIEEAQGYFGEDVDFYVDGGNLSGRPPSTLVRVTDSGYEVIRQGSVKLS
jgi:L-threonylcarbamoyladenylate synthase